MQSRLRNEGRRKEWQGLFENIDYELVLWTVVAIVGFLIIMIVDYICRVLLPLKEKRDYIIMEMERAEGKEYIYWQDKLKKMYSEELPVVGRILGKFIK